MNATSVVSTATERQTVRKKRKTETTIRLKESPASTGNATTVVKEFTGLLIVGLRKEKRKTMTSITYSWEQHYVDKSKERMRKKTLKNSVVIAEHHHISITRRKI